MECDFPCPTCHPDLAGSGPEAGLRGWTVREGVDDDGSYFIESTVMPGLVVAADTKEAAWAEWPEVVEMWATTANENRVTAERALAATPTASPTAPRHRPEMLDDVPTGFCECGLVAGHAASPTATGEDK